MVVPINDVALIEVEKMPTINGQELVSSEKKEGIEEGILVALPEELPYMASNGWAFEGSLGDTEMLARVRKYYEPLIGKRVIWEWLAERGVEIEQDGKHYVLLKLTKILGYYDK